MTCQQRSSCPVAPNAPYVPPSPAQLGGPAIVGESPGRQEAREGRPFVGRSGQLLRAVLTDHGVDPNLIWITNAVLCFTGETPTPEAITSCRPRLLDELHAYGPSKILALGNSSLQSLFPGAQGIMAARGRPRWHDELKCYVVPSVHPAAVLRAPDLVRDLATDIALWAELPERHEPVEVHEGLTYSVVSTRRGLQQMRRAIRQAHHVALDIETTGLNPRSDRLLTIGIATAPDQLFVIPGLIDSTLKAILEDTSPRWVAHNGAQFDAPFLRACGVDWHPGFDTLLAHYTLDERQGSHGLKQLAAQYFMAPDYAVDVKNVADVPLEDLEWYQALDVHYTHRLYDRLHGELERENLLRVHDELLLPAAEALSIVEETGVKVDPEYLGQLRVQFEGELHELLDQIKASAGTPLNPNSPKQVQTILVAQGVLPRGSSTGREVLEPLQSRSPLVKLILDYRLKSKLLSTYVDGLLDRVDPVDGRVHADFLLFGTETGRLSSRNPNLQNIPQLVGPIIRRAFVAEPGYILVEADYSQLELRIAAYYSRDRVLLKAYREGLDIHTQVAADVFRVPYDKVTYEQRYIAKYIDFGIIYGRQAHSLATGELQCSVAEAQSYIDRFLSQFPDLRAWIRQQQAQAIEQGFVETPFGRRRRFPLVTDENVGDIQRQSVNTPIQSLASDVCLTSLTRLVNTLDLRKCRPVSTVHDSILFEVLEAEVDRYVEIIRTEMETGCPIPITDTVPLKVDLKISHSWGEKR